MHICRYFHDDPLPQEIRSELEDELFTRLVGRAPDSAEDRRRATPIQQTLRRLLATADFERFTAENERMSERLAHEAVHWVGHRWAQIDQPEELVAEDAAIDRLASAPTPATEQIISDLSAALVEQRPELAAIARAAHAGPAAPGSGNERGDARRRLDLETRRAFIARAWRGRVAEDRSWQQARALGKAVGGFIRELQQILPGLAAAQELVRDALGNEDALWDLSMHEWEELDTEGIAASASLLRDHPEIVRLAEILGRSRSVTAEHRVQRIERHVHRHSVGIGKSEIAGICTGNDPTSLLASELALLAESDTQDLFYAKLARRELLMMDYRSEEVVEDVRLRRVWSTERLAVDRGPLVVCVDTSGSMLGLPEQIAKAVVLALAQRLELDRRRVEVIAFASQVRSFTLDHEHARLSDLARFLRGGFHGGTDLSRALRAALTTLEEEHSRHADVLVVSDFRVPKIADRHLDRIDRQRASGTLFHTLTIGRAAVHDPLNVFDSSWFFDTSTGRIGADTLQHIR